MSDLIVPANGEWLGIRLSLGSYLPAHPAATLRDRRDVDLADLGGNRFGWQGGSWEYPTFEHAEEFVARLVKAGLIARDPAVTAALRGEARALTRRSAQRHFLWATGLSHATHRVIARARHAAQLLREGLPIAETVHRAGYFDQAHLTRTLRRLLGATPGQMQRREAELSFLYKTRSPDPS